MSKHTCLHDTIEQLNMQKLFLEVTQTVAVKILPTKHCPRALTALKSPCVSLPSSPPPTLLPTPHIHIHEPFQKTRRTQDRKSKRTSRHPSRPTRAPSQHCARLHPWHAKPTRSDRPATAILLLFGDPHPNVSNVTSVASTVSPTSDQVHR
jgi:hypothetical protein